jgi:hypothetical protein
MGGLLENHQGVLYFKNIGDKLGVQITDAETAEALLKSVQDIQSSSQMSLFDKFIKPLKNIISLPKQSIQQL